MPNGRIQLSRRSSPTRCKVAWKLPVPNCTHLICRPDETGSLTNLKTVRHPIYRSGTRELSRADVEALVGGCTCTLPRPALPGSADE